MSGHPLPICCFNVSIQWHKIRTLTEIFISFSYTLAMVSENLMIWNK